MIRLSILYPKGEDTTFDFEYYKQKHIPLAVSTFGVQGAEIDKGVDGPYVAAAHFLFESAEALGAAMSPDKAGPLMADIPNYTNSQPSVQVSEIIS